MNERPDVSGEQLTVHDFETLPLARLAAVTGLTPPASPTAEQERAWREKAYQDYELDLENRAEWGTAAQGTELPGDPDQD